MTWAIWVLWTSSLLNAAYFLPILWRAWFRPSRTAWPDEHILPQGRRETAWLLLLPPLLTASAALIAGFAGEASWSPLAWATLIADREYLQWTP
jgi:multicomponent Na+:H+ antiporter subunit D